MGTALFRGRSIFSHSFITNGGRMPLPLCHSLQPRVAENGLTRLTKTTPRRSSLCPPFLTMKGRRSLALSLLILCATSVTTITAVSAEKLATIPLPANFTPPAGKLVFKDGDSVVFLGDSITAQSLYTQYLEDFFFTRFPKIRMHFHNAGTGGDRIADAFERFDIDVAAFKPQYVTVLFGMNDGNFTDWQEATFETFQKDMTTLLDRIGALGATPIPMTPTMFDALPDRLNDRIQEPRDKAYNDVLKTYAAWIREQGKARKIVVADVYVPLVDATNERRRTEADWTMIPDTMHPTPVGHVIMAAAFLNDVAFCPSVSEILIAKKNNEWAGTVGNGELSDLQGGEKITFTFAAESLPWVLPPEAEEGRKMIPQAYKKPPKLSSEKLAVRGLAPGNYELKIDGETVGRWTDAELAAGVDLGENPKTPQYQQALKVALLNKDRNYKTEHPLRIEWALLKGQRHLLKTAEEANESPARVEQAKKSFNRFFEPNQKSIAEYVAASHEAEEAIYKANQPVPRKYELSPVDGDGK
jgi:lysophospholipase L1-like esterase